MFSDPPAPPWQDPDPVREPLLAFNRPGFRNIWEAHMLVHVVLFKLRDPQPAVIAKALELMNGMRGKIPGLLSLEAGSDVVHSRRSYDLVLIAGFRSREDLEQYMGHPVHVPVSDFIRTVGETSVTVDYETDREGTP